MSPSTESPTESKKIHGVHVVPLKSFADDRGYFFESYRRTWVPGVRDMVQGNCSFSKKGVLRGLHYHLKQADFWVVPKGHVRAALYDLRPSSPTRGSALVLEMGEPSPVGLYIPKGVAHGFLALTDSFMTYLVDEYYDNSDEPAGHPRDVRVTRSFACWSDSKVPASVHQPGRTSNVRSPRLM